MTHDEIKAAWNAQADDGDRWHSLSEGEKVEWAAIHAATKEREACAKVCDPKPGIRYSPNSQSARQQCAAAIRARQ